MVLKVGVATQLRVLQHHDTTVIDVVSSFVAIYADWSNIATLSGDERTKLNSFFFAECWSLQHFLDC